MSKPLYFEVLDNEHSRKAGNLVSHTFDSLDEATEAAKVIADRYRVKVTVRGRRGNAHYMKDGRWFADRRNHTPKKKRGR